MLTLGDSALGGSWFLFLFLVGSFGICSVGDIVLPQLIIQPLFLYQLLDESLCDLFLCLFLVILVFCVLET